jgi:hypothetical protein
MYQKKPSGEEPNAAKLSFCGVKKYRTCLPAGRHRIRNAEQLKTLNPKSNIRNPKFITSQPAGWFDINSFLT